MPTIITITITATIAVDLFYVNFTILNSVDNLHQLNSGDSLTHMSWITPVLYNLVSIRLFFPLTEPWVPNHKPYDS